MRRSLLLLLALNIWPTRLLVAQEQRTPAVPTTLSVFLDCRGGCDSDLIRTEINYVNWVRDRAVADVHVLVTNQQGGAGGQRFTLAFIGLRGFAGRGDTLIFDTNPTTTSDERRRGVMRTIAIGLMQFIGRTSVARAIRISQSEEERVLAITQTKPANDPWKAWVFEVGVNGSMKGERYYRNRELESSFEARRTTEAWKSSLELGLSYRDSRATVQDFDSLGQVTSEETFKNLQRNWSSEFLLVKSVTGHLSAGMRNSLESNTFRNQRLNAQFMSALEYDLFPYSEATRRELSLRYGVGANYFHYADTTIFDKIRETRPLQLFEINYQTRQPWGSTSVSLSHTNYLSDASKRRTEIEGNLNLRVFQGFSVNFAGGYNWIRDQLYIPKEGSSQVDVLLRRRALLTGFEYFTHFGVSYTFGSIFNNVVNPRF
jgi:hypothetical protein